MEETLEEIVNGNIAESGGGSPHLSVHIFGRVVVKHIKIMSVQRTDANPGVSGVIASRLGMVLLLALMIISRKIAGIVAFIISGIII